MLNSFPHLHFLRILFVSFAACALPASPATGSAADGQMADRNGLFAVRIDSGARRIACRTMPFLACPTAERGETRRIQQGAIETIPVGAEARALYLLGMFNEGWDHGLAHWGEHMEFRDDRTDQIVIGTQLGELEIVYTDGERDRIPLMMGATLWNVSHWAFGPSNSVMKPVREPFVSRPDYAAILKNSLLLYEDEELPRLLEYKHFYLAIKPRAKMIESLRIHDNPGKRGRPLVSGITLATSNPADHLTPFGDTQVDPADLVSRLDVMDSMDWSNQLKALSDTLYTGEGDLPEDPELLSFPEDFDAARLRFIGGGRWGNMLSNVWTANLGQIGDKFDAETGFFHETGADSPWYGGYCGIGTWAPDVGVYSRWCYARSSDHLATVGMRLIHSPERWTNFVDLVDRILYYYRANHDPELGPDNHLLDISKYPKDAPPHWSYVLNEPWGGTPVEINEIMGNEEMDGHGATVTARWSAWRLMGSPAGDWLLKPREDVYGKSRWDSTRDSAEFICWLMDYTGRDVIYSEGESTGWGGHKPLHRCPPGMPDQPKSVEERHKKYAEANMYEVYPSYMCYTGLRCAAQMADAAGEQAVASRWRSYADRIAKAMVAELVIKDGEREVWHCTPSVFPSKQESLAPAWGAIYIDGLDPKRWASDIRNVTHNTLNQHIESKPGCAQPLAMGYGQGWLTHAALAVDEMDSAGECLINIAKFTYDKNMDYVDEARGIDWRKWLYIVPEGTHPMPDGRWYRTGDLSNGANQGPAMHALEVCAGIDDTDPSQIKIMPRVPDPLTGLEVSNFLTVIADGDKTQIARVTYKYEKGRSFSLSADKPLPNLAVRLGPYANEGAARRAITPSDLPEGAEGRLERSGRYQDAQAWWIWIEGMSGPKSIALDLGE